MVAAIAGHSSGRGRPDVLLVGDVRGCRVRYVYTRDAAGHLRALDVEDGTGGHVFGWTYALDDADRLVTQTLTVPDHGPDRTTFHYCD